MPINVAIIGCAKIAHLHAKAILANSRTEL